MMETGMLALLCGLTGSDADPNECAASPTMRHRWQKGESHDRQRPRTESETRAWNARRRAMERGGSGRSREKPIYEIPTHRTRGRDRPG